MAQKVLVSLVDDLDGSEAEETVEFGLDGVSYQIDLSSDNAEELRDALAQYVEHARRAGGRKRASVRPVSGKGSARPAAVDREQNQAIRAWARKNGYAVSDRGRIPVRGRRGLPQEELRILQLFGCPQVLTAVSTGGNSSTRGSSRRPPGEFARRLCSCPVAVRCPFGCPPGPSGRTRRAADPSPRGNRG